MKSFFDGWEEAKAAGPEAMKAWENTPVTMDEVTELVDANLKANPVKAGEGMPAKMAFGWVLLLRVVGLPVLRKIAASMPDGPEKDILLDAIGALEIFA